MTSSAMFRLSREIRNPKSGIRIAFRIWDLVSSPVLLEVDVPLDLRLRLVRLEAALLQNLNHPRRLWVDALARGAVLRRHANHVGVAAQKHVGACGVEFPAEALFQLAAGDHVLDVLLVSHGL